MKIPVVVTFISVLLFSMGWVSRSAMADDFYVITATHKTQQEAQKQAALTGGWVLNTNFYDKLKPNLFSVVRGPFRTKQEADKEAASLKRMDRYKDSYVKNAGTINISVRTGNKEISPHIIAALLGEIRVDINNEKGASNPCEPQEPYSYVSLSFYTIKRDWDKKKEEILRIPDEITIDMGATRVIKSTGAVERMRICAE